ncbi:hypothetical protein GCM10009584_02830 [Ornithinimicrobium humiphilum]|uniref:Copper(I)-binding protein n=1 Tax=Ornithinimicrobium humiphilum TaxID=125288 RepID=A0A543K7F4_9MICO|nr:hypothetical protein [Ornithinimicrobium humiphilum]TQM91019.1 hypothetical protein FB476_2737 [Ornithinimicrobium humiphilum]
MITARSSRTRRRATILTATAVGVLALSGCQVTNPTTTMLRYAPADGIELDGDSVDVRDLLVVSHGDGAPAVVSGSVVNSGTEAITVTVSVEGQELSPQLTVDPGTAVRLDGTQPDGTEGERLILPALESPSGQSVEVRITTDSGETLGGRAPVLLPQGHYEQFADDAGGTVEPRQAEDHGEDH